jgi:mxaJ protein
MSSHFRDAMVVRAEVRLVALAVAIVVLLGAEARDDVDRAKPPAEHPRVLRVASDPNNLPFSNDRREGFENKIAELIARELGAEVEYTWHAQRRSFFRATLKEGDCDVAIGCPARFDRCLTTSPYYRSTYAFVSRADRKLDVRSFDDPRLRFLRVGVHLVGDDGTNTPPAHALARRGIVDNLVGFTLYDDYSQANPPARVIEAVARGAVDVAIVWGPIAGYFAEKQEVPLTVTPVAEQTDPPVLPLAFDIAVGVRRGSPELRDQIDRILVDKRPEIEAILKEYRVPRVPRPAGEAAARIDDDDDD